MTRPLAPPMAPANFDEPFSTDSALDPDIQRNVFGTSAAADQLGQGVLFPDGGRSASASSTPA